MAFFKVNRKDPNIIEGRSVGPCNCSRFTWQVAVFRNGRVQQEREVCLDCQHSTGRNRPCT